MPLNIIQLKINEENLDSYIINEVVTIIVIS